MFCVTTVVRLARERPALISTSRGGAFPKLAWNRETFCTLARSMTIVAGAVVSGCQFVALLPSIAANPYCPATTGRDGPTSLNRVSLAKETRLTHSARLLAISRESLLFPVGTMSDSPTRRV